MDDKQKKAERWDALVKQGVSPEDAASQVEKEFGRAGVKSPDEIAALNAADQPGNPLQEAGKSVVGGIRSAIGSVPGGARLMAFGRALDEALPFKEALAKQRGDIEAFGEENPKAATALGVAANLPLFRALPLAIAGSTKIAGAAAGGGAAAASRFAAPTEESMGSRVAGTAMSGVGGAAVGAVAPWLLSNPIARTATGTVAGGLLAPEGYGVEGAIAGGTAAAAAPWAIDKIGQQMGSGVSAIREAMGARGQVNREMEGMQRVLAPFKVNIGEAPRIGQKVNEFAKRFHDQSAKFFAKAEADKQVLADPEVIGILKDPDVFKAFTAAYRLRAAEGRPIPLGARGQVLPDPESLHLTKRLLADEMAPGFKGERTIPLEISMRIRPQLDRLRDILHKRSPDYRMADEFFTLGKTAEEGVQRGYGAVKPGQRNPSAGGIGETDVAGAEKFITDLPVGRRQDVARMGVRRGAEAQVAQQLSAKDLQGGRQGLLDSPILDLAGPQAEQRALALGPDAGMFEDMLKTLRTETAEDVGKTGLLDHIGAYLRLRQGPVAMNVHGKATPPLDKPKAQALLSDVIRDPKEYQKTLQKYLRGKGLLDLLSLNTSGSAGVMVGR